MLYSYGSVSNDSTSSSSAVLSVFGHKKLTLQRPTPSPQQLSANDNETAAVGFSSPVAVNNAINISLTAASTVISSNEDRSTTAKCVTDEDVQNQAPLASFEDFGAGSDSKLIPFDDSYGKDDDASPIPRPARLPGRDAARSGTRRAPGCRNYASRSVTRSVPPVLTSLAARSENFSVSPSSYQGPFSNVPAIIINQPQRHQSANLTPNYFAQRIENINRREHHARSQEKQQYLGSIKSASITTSEDMFHATYESRVESQYATSLSVSSMATPTVASRSWRKSQTSSFAGHSRRSRARSQRSDRTPPVGISSLETSYSRISSVAPGGRRNQTLLATAASSTSASHTYHSLDFSSAVDGGTTPPPVFESPRMLSYGRSERSSDAAAPTVSAVTENENGECLWLGSFLQTAYWREVFCCD